MKHTNGNTNKIDVLDLVILLVIGCVLRTAGSVIKRDIHRLHGGPGFLPNCEHNQRPARDGASTRRSIGTLTPSPQRFLGNCLS